MFSQLTNGIKNKYKKTAQITQASVRMIAYAESLSELSYAKAEAKSKNMWSDINEKIKQEAESFNSLNDKGLYVHFLAFQKASITFAAGIFDDLELQRECLNAINELDQLMHDQKETIQNDLILFLNLLFFRIRIYQCILEVEAKKPNKPSLGIDVNLILKSTNKFLKLVAEKKKKMDFFDHAQFSWFGHSARLVVNFHRLRFDSTIKHDDLVVDIQEDIETIEKNWLQKTSKLSTVARRQGVINRSLAQIEIGIVRDDWPLISKGLYSLIDLTGIPARGEDGVDLFEIDLEHLLWCLKAVEYRELSADMPLGYDASIERMISIAHRMYVSGRYQKNHTFLETGVLLSNIYVKRENWEGVVAVASRVFENVRQSIGINRDLEDFQHHVTNVQKLGSEAAFAALQIASDDKAKPQKYSGIELVEASRSLTWKFGREKFVHRKGETDLFDISKFSINQECQNRVNIFVDVATNGTALHILDNTSRKGSVYLVRLPNFTRQVLDEFMNSESGWIYAYDKFRCEASSLLIEAKSSAWADWNEMVAHALSWLWHNIGKAIHEALLEIGILQNSHVHIVSSAPLMNLPLHACGIKNEKGAWWCLNDNWLVTVSDSVLHNMYLPAEMVDRPNHRKNDHRLAIINPSGDIRLKSGNFPNCLVLSGKEATKLEVVKQLRVSASATFFCHAQFDKNTPEASGLELTAGDILSLSDIRNLDLLRAPVVMLGACESTVADALFQGDEARNLAAGLLWAGASAVIGSAWPVTIECAESTIKPIFNMELETAKQHATHLTNIQRQMRGAKRATCIPIEAISTATGSNDNVEKLLCGDGGYEDFSMPAAWASFSIYIR
ncbi:CHAT domain-containing protein [Thalassospira alkalitolerans]|nr:CHAT domain-containing protein [Thalassospira alkalitolerans]